MEVGYSQPIHNESTPTSENGSQSGAEAGAVASTGSGFSHCSPREGRESICSAHTAVMEEDSYRNVHPSCNENRTGMDLPCDNRFYEGFDDITEISQGSFGQVMKAREKKENEFYAVKIVPQRKTDENRLLREVTALELLRHQNIVRCYHFWWGMSEVNILDESEESDSSSRRGRGPEFCLFIQMELCELSLYDWIWKRNGDTAETVNKDRSLRIFRQIVDGVTYIHSQMFIHRDLKPRNIFLTTDMLVKIGDFGLVTRVSWEDKSQQRRTQYIGTEDYMAPEQKEDNYESEVDIFPLGLILFELLWKFGSETERAKTWEKIRSGDFPTGFEAHHPDEAREIRKMLSQEPRRRPSAEDLKKRF